MLLVLLKGWLHFPIVAAAATPAVADYAAPLLLLILLTLPQQLLLLLLQVAGHKLQQLLRLHCQVATDKVCCIVALRTWADEQPGGGWPAAVTATRCTPLLQMRNKHSRAAV
jgi:hypothetical protein